LLKSDINSVSYIHFKFTNPLIFLILEISSNDFELNVQIVGKAIKCRDQLGIIKYIFDDEGKLKISILFAKNKLRTVSINRINISANSQVSNHLNHTSDGPGNQATVGSGFIDDVEVSSISSDEENNLLNEGFLE
jgi:regulation of enolase protein 1 (concanavalin A-like superfamily)